MPKRIRILLLFLVAAVSLLLAGQLLNPQGSAGESLLLLWLGMCGTICIYGLDLNSGNATDLKGLAGSLFNTPFKKAFMLQFIVLIIPASVLYLSVFRLAMLGVICFFGWLYSAGFTRRGSTYRVKDTLFLKNIFIGFGWGALVLVGAGAGGNAQVLALFVFTSLQIVVGSAIRDIPDAKNDSASGMRTLPVIYGADKTLNLLHAANLLTFLPGYAICPSREMGLLMLIIIAWKGLILLKVKVDKTAQAWTQTLNILTCSFILILVLIEYAYETV